ncbi:MAG: hypothetical protein PVF33_01060 [Candidatus Latescibacterota bacterium]
MTRDDAASGGVAIVAGSGMGALADLLCARLVGKKTVAFEEIEGVGRCTVDGHVGEVSVGRYHAGEREGRRVAIVRGRRHTYEGGEQGMAPLMRWLAGIGTRDVIGISAAGSVNSSIHPGDLVAVREVIDLQNRDRVTPPFRPSGSAGRNAGRLVNESVSERGAHHGPAAVSPRLTRALEAAAREAGVAMHRGSAASVAGPAYETPSEVSTLQTMGVDVATMSAAPEVQFAAEAGMEIAIVAAITNRCTGVGLERPDHARVLDAAGGMCGALGRVVLQLIGIY